jgi:cytoskeletal protein CcmA (bactofilin family)
LKVFGPKTNTTLPIQGLIGSDMKIEGNVHFKGGLRIDGEVRGNVTTDADDKSLLVVSETGAVIGSVSAAHVVISGSVEGPVDAIELLELHPSSKVSGNVRYSVLEMHPGAIVDGTLRHERHAEQQEEAAPSKLALASSHN